MAKKFFFKNELKNIPHKVLKEYLHTEIFSTEEFKNHVKRVSFKLNIDEVIVFDVLTHYFTSVAYTINTVRKIKTKINIYGFFSIFIEKGRRV